MLTRLYLVATFIRVGKQAGCHAFLEFNGQKKLLVFFGQRHQKCVTEK